jgi:hypothetical protein
VPIFQRFTRWLENRFPPFKRAVEKMEPRLRRWGLDPNGPEYLERAAAREARREARKRRRERRQQSRARLRPATSK